MSCRRITVTGVDTLTAGDSLALTINPITPTNYWNYEICLNVDLSGSDATGAEVVTLTDGTNTYDLLDCVAGNPVTVMQLWDCCKKIRGIFRITYGENATPHFLVKYPALRRCGLVVPAAAE